MIQLKNLSKSFNSLSVLNQINLEIIPGEFLGLLGPSGCGKSTLLRIIADLEKPTAGERVVTKNNLNMSYVFQDAELLSWRSVEQNILLPLELTRRPFSPDHLEEVLALVKLEKFRKYYPDQLSGGMKMRVSLARALITNPELILMDEPFSSLDENTRFELQDQLVSLQRKKKMSIVFVTHSIGEAVYLSNRVQVLSLHNGKQIFELTVSFEGRENFKSSVVYNHYVTLLSQKMQLAKLPSENNLDKISQ